MEKPTIWVIDDDVALRMILEDALTDAGFSVQTFGNAKIALHNLENLTNSSNFPAVILTDIRMPMMDGLTFSDKVHAQFPQIPLIIMTAHADVQSAVDSYQTGAFDYLPKPFDLDDMLKVVKKAIQQKSSIKNSNPAVDNLIKNPHPSFNSIVNEIKANTVEKPPTTEQFTPPSGIIGQSPAMQTVFRAIGRLSNTPITVLITGESGTGKELIANALHEHSPRKNKPFIALNMAAIPHDLIESELFGHEKGAFTGATTTRQGRFEQAHGGTLFLDEIGDMPLPTQTRLLRVLANGEFFRVGGLKPIKVDVRIIAATHQNLENLVKQGKFREDLFYRLNVIRLALPALRERREDIPLLVNFLLQDIAKKMHLPGKQLSSDTMQVLQAFDWQGNVRQLENVCRWLMVMATGNVIQINDLPPEILDNYYQTKSTTKTPTENQTTVSNQPVIAALQKPTIETQQLPPKIDTFNSSNPLTSLSEKLLPNMSADNQDWLTPLFRWAQQALQSGEAQILQTASLDFERCLLQAALQYTGNHKGKSAELLGWGRNTVTRKFQQLLNET